MTGCCDMPAGRKKLVGGFCEIVSRTTQFFRIGQHDQRMLGQHALHRLHVIDQCGKQRFHAFDRNGIGNGFQHVFGVGNGSDQGFRTLAHLVGQLQFTAWRGPNHRNVLTIRALIRSVELPDGIDLITEELNTHRMRQCRRKHVDNAASHREFTTIHHQVDSSIGVFHQSTRRLFERQFLALREHQRLHVGQTCNHWLDQGSHRHDENADGSEQLASLLRVL